MSNYHVGEVPFAMLADPSNPSPQAIRAKIVRVGNSVGVRLPASLHLALGTEVEVTVRAVQAWPEGYFDQEPVGEDFQVPARESGKAHERRLRNLFGPEGRF